MKVLHVLLLLYYYYVLHACTSILDRWPIVAYELNLFKEVIM